MIGSSFVLFFDADIDVDRFDYGLFHGCMSGPDVLADPACAE